MTLIISIIQPDYIWQSSDNRVSVRNRFRDDDHIKHVGMKCLDGTALLTYTGLAELVDGTKISDWVRTTIRGETRTVEQSIQLIADKASQEVSNSYFLVFLIAAFIERKAWIYQVTNGDGKNWISKPLKVNFSVTKMQVKEPLAVLAGSGSFCMSKADKDLLTKITGKKPRSSEEYFGLLSGINKRTAVLDQQHVSESCVTVGMPAEGEPVQTRVYGFDNSYVIRNCVPFILLGIDSTEIMGALKNQSTGIRPGDETTLNKISELARKAIKSRYN